MSVQPQFLFKKPTYINELSEEANLLVAFGALASRLVKEERSRTIHPDGRRENVAEHSYMLAKIATYLAAEFYPELDRAKIALHAINHDDPEAYVGDTPTDPIGNPDFVEKQAREAAGVAQQVLEYKGVSETYTNDLLEYEAQQTPEARFVRMVDKITVILIQIPDDFRTIKQHYTRESFNEFTDEIHQRLLDEYPEWKTVIDLRSELAHYLSDQHFKPAS